MKVFMDRNKCSVWQAACESCFANHLIKRDFLTNDCVLEVVEDEEAQIAFYMRDRDGDEKVLIVDESNWPEAYDSWSLLWEKQQIKLAESS